MFATTMLRVIIKFKKVANANCWLKRGLRCQKFREIRYKAAIYYVNLMVS